MKEEGQEVERGWRNVDSGMTSTCHCAVTGLTGHQGTTITVCVCVCVLKPSPQEPVLLHRPCARVYPRMSRRPYAKRLEFPLGFPILHTRWFQRNHRLKKRSLKAKRYWAVCCSRWRTLHLRGPNYNWKLKPDMIAIFSLLWVKNHRFTCLSVHLIQIK